MENEREDLNTRNARWIGERSGKSYKMDNDRIECFEKNEEAIEQQQWMERDRKKRKDKIKNEKLSKYYGHNPQNYPRFKRTFSNPPIVSFQRNKNIKQILANTKDYIQNSIGISDRCSPEKRRRRGETQSN